MVITFYRRPSRVPWAPVPPITAKRLRAAKILLITAAANFVFSVVLVAWERRGASERALSMVLTSFALLNATYIAIHWRFVLKIYSRPHSWHSFQIRYCMYCHVFDYEEPLRVLQGRANKRSPKNRA
jgi:hypothetical protein